MEPWLSPAKINLYLAITGIREQDGFHELDSIVATLNFGDRLWVKLSETAYDRFECNDTRLTWDAGNLVRKAVEMYRKRTGYLSPLDIRLEKVIPLGAGLGGGSSNAVTMLKALNSLNPMSVPPEDLQSWSAYLGSDCPLFFGSGIMRMRGRGEVLSAVPDSIVDYFSAKTMVVFHPGFGISAAWAYKQLKLGYPVGYTESEVACEELNNWEINSANWTHQWRNDLQSVAEQKYLAIPVLKQQLKTRLGLPMMMSGSGSACFCVVEDEKAVSDVIDCVRESWGMQSFVRACRISF